MSRIPDVRARLAGALALTIALSGCGADQPPAQGETPAPVPGATATAPTAGQPATAAATVPTWKPLNEVVAGTATSNCHIDSLAGVENKTEAHLQQGAALAVSGWLATQAGDAVPATASVRVEDGSNGRVWEVPIATFTPRPDVAQAAGKPGLANSGFAVSIDTHEFPKAAKHVYLAFSQDGKDFICDGGHQVIID